MDNLIFSLNASVPIFILMVLGMIFHKVGLVDDIFASKMNKFVFQIPLPVLLFRDLATVDFHKVWNLKLIIFCFLVTLICICISVALSLVCVEGADRGEFIQSSYRSSAALLGIAFIENIYGDAGMAPVMILASVPLYNIMAVTVLVFFKPDSQGFSKKMIKDTLIGIATNPIIIGIFIGMLWSILKVPLSGIPLKVVDNVAATSTPMGLISMGATINLKKAMGKIKPTVVATFVKLVGFVAIFLPIAVALGFRKEELIAILVMLGSSTTVSCFVMAKNMGHEGTLSSSVIMLTTLISSFTLTLWLYILRSFSLI